MLGQLMRWIFICYIFMTIKHSPKVADSAFAFFDTILYNTVSNFHESCDKRWVTKDVQGLERALQDNVFGQHLATEILTTALRAYVNRQQPRSKPLVFNFQGSSGGGKGYVADFVLKYWFKNGEHSRFVKKYVGKMDFPEESQVAVYQRKLKFEIEETISKCSMAVFVFDEVDKMPPKVLDGIKAYLEYYSIVNGYDYRDAIFIFITNNGFADITNIVHHNLNDGLQREELNYEHFENALKIGTFNQAGGFYQTDLIRHHLIDYFVPFLPLEKEHVARCIEAEMMNQGGNMNDIKGVTEKIIKDMEFRPDDDPIFSASGCKSVDEKVSYHIELDRRRQKKRHSEF